MTSHIPGITSDTPPAARRKRIYVASPLRGDIAGNLRRAAAYCLVVSGQGHSPFAPHLFYASFLDDTNPVDRALGMAMGLDELQRCDELHAFGRPSEGMAAEIALATQLGIPVRHFPAIH